MVSMVGACIVASSADATAQEIQLTGPLLGSHALGTSYRLERLELSLASVAIEDPARDRVDSLVGFRAEYHPRVSERGRDAPADWLGVGASAHVGVTGTHDARGILGYAGPEVTLVPHAWIIPHVDAWGRAGVALAFLRNRLGAAVGVPATDFSVGVSWHVSHHIGVSALYGALVLLGDGTGLRPMVGFTLDVFFGERREFCRWDPLEVESE
jgi:hypothetical protein